MKSILKDLFRKEEKYRITDEREMMEFNQIVVFCFKALILLITQFIVFQDIYLFKEMGKYTLPLGLIGFVCFIGCYKLCRKGILFANKNYDVLLPTFLFFPFFILRIEVLVIEHSFYIELASFIKWIFLIVNIAIIYFCLNRVYKKHFIEIDKLINEFDD